jgi:sulfate transport system substrate-binding protein
VGIRAGSSGASFLFGNHATRFVQIVKHNFRPRTNRIAEKHRAKFPRMQLFTVQEVFGGWTQAQRTHFDDGAVFDQVFVAAR